MVYDQYRKDMRSRRAAFTKTCERPFPYVIHCIHIYSLCQVSFNLSFFSLFPTFSPHVVKIC